MYSKLVRLLLFLFDGDGSWKSYREKEKQRENIGEIGEYRFWEYFQGGGDRFFLAPCIQRRGMNIHNFTFVRIGYHENFYGERIIAAVNSGSFVS